MLQMTLSCLMDFNYERKRMKRVIKIIGALAAIGYLQGCVSTDSASTVSLEKLGPNEYYIDKGLHFLCHKEKDAMDAMRTLIYMNIRKGAMFTDKNLCILVSPSDHVKVKRITTRWVVLDGVSVPLDRVQILTMDGMKAPQGWSGSLWMVDAMEDYVVKKGK